VTNVLNNGGRNFERAIDKGCDGRYKKRRGRINQKGVLLEFMGCRMQSLG